MCSLFQERTETVDLTSDQTLLVDISDALSEKDKVKFTVHTKVETCHLNCDITHNYDAHD